MSDSRARGGRGRGGARGGAGGGRGGDAGRGGNRGGSQGPGQRGPGDRGGRARGDYRGGSFSASDVHGSRGGGGGGGGHGGGGGGRGDFRGGRGGDFRGGRGSDFRGGRRGDFRGGRGDHGGGGRGNRGGRGGPRGPDPFEGDLDVWGAGQAIPQPAAAVTKLEDDFIKQQNSSAANITSNMGKLSVQGAGSSKPTATTFPVRPTFGSRGQKVVLWANYFELEVKLTSLSKYSLVINWVNMDENAGDKDFELKGRKLQAVIELALATLGKSTLATEFKGQVVSLVPLVLPEDNTVQVQVTEPGRNRIKTYAVKFNGPSPIRVDELVSFLSTMKGNNDESFAQYEDAIDALGVVLGHFARTSNNTATLGRGRFFPTNLSSEQINLEDRDWSPLVLIRGYFQSVRAATGRLLLNANVTHGVFRRAGRLDELIKTWGLNCMDQVQSMAPRDRTRLFAQLRKLSRALQLARVMCTMRDDKRQEREVEKVAAGLAKTTDGSGEQKPRFAFGQEFGGPADVRFFVNPPKGGAQQSAVAPNQWITVAEYYQKRYGFSVNSSMPLVNVRTRLKPVYFPAELCRILPGQPMKAKLSQNESKVMINFACRSPYKNAHSLSTVGRGLLGLDANPLLEEFGISVMKELITVHGRVLPSPSVVYSGVGASENPDVRSPKAGSWNMQGARVARPGRRIINWTYIHISLVNARSAPSPADVTGAVREFVDFMINNMGINMEPTPRHPNGVSISSQDGSFEADIRGAFSRLASDKTLPEFALIILPDKITSLYNAVKALADVEYGFHTICAVQGKLLMKNPQYFANVALKFNLKAGGVNHMLKDDLNIIAAGKTMVVGYDVTHPTNLAPGKGTNDLPSQVGMVASIDKNLAQWPAVTWNNPSKVEMLDEHLTEAFASRLRLWQKHNSEQLPDNVIIFRDGVSESQFSQVMTKELPLIRMACEPLYRGRAAPRLSIIVSVKRHQTRFYATDPQLMDSGSRNTRSGTVVDRGVTLARYWDFFLQAHTALKGTARPARYTVLLDEIFRSTYGVGNAANELEKLTHDMCYLFGRATKAVSICPPAYYADILCTRSRVHMADLYETSTSASQVEGAQEILKRQVHENLRDSMYYI